MMRNNNKDYSVKVAFNAVNIAAGRRLRLGAGSCNSNCNCSYCTRMRQRRQETNQRLRSQLNRMYQQAKQDRQIREQREVEWEKTKRLLSLFDRR